MPNNLRRTIVGLTVTVVVLLLMGAPLVGWPPLVRVTAVLLAGASVVMAVQWARLRVSVDRLERWTPPRSAELGVTLTIFCLVLWVVITRFYSGGVNGVDFTVYFDRPCFQTSQGHPLFVESADRAGYAYRSQLAVHSHWLLLACGPLYSLAATPFWLLTLTALSVAVGAFYIQRIVRQVTGSGSLAFASAIAFALNRNTAQVVNQGFHPEVLYLWFVPWFVDAALGRRKLGAAAAALSMILLKEDALMPLFAASAALWLGDSKPWKRSDILFFLVLPCALAFAHLVAYYRLIVPLLSPTGRPTYAEYWASWGTTPVEAVVSMATQPTRLLLGALTSAFFTATLVPHLFLPLAGWRWSVGLIPIVLVYSAADEDQIRSFGLYYPAILVPLLVVAAAAGAIRLLRWRSLRGVARPWAAAAGVIVLASLAFGSTTGGYSLRPWRSEIEVVAGLVESRAPSELILVQSGLYPHAGYSENVQLLTPDNLRTHAHRSPFVLVSRSFGAYPFEGDELNVLVSEMTVVAEQRGIVLLGSGTEDPD